MSTNKYVLAKDEDFEKDTQGSFIYIGKEPYIEIPHIIQGNAIVQYDLMFERNKYIRGIKSTNKNITSAAGMFLNCKGDVLDLSEFNMTNIIDATNMFRGAYVKKIIWPKDKMPLCLDWPNGMFFKLTIPSLDLSGFNFSGKEYQCVLEGLQSQEIIFSEQSLSAIISCEDNRLGQYCPLQWIPIDSQTEYICWIAILCNKKNGRYAKIKSKKILMYLGDECPEYIKFYYNKENLNEKNKLCTCKG